MATLPVRFPILKLSWSVFDSLTNQFSPQQCATDDVVASFSPSSVASGPVFQVLVRHTILVSVSLREKSQESAAALETLRRSRIDFNYEQLPFVVIHRRLALSIAVKVFHQIGGVQKLMRLQLKFCSVSDFDSALREFEDAQCPILQTSAPTGGGDFRGVSSKRRNVSSFQTPDSLPRLEPARFYSQASSTVQPSPQECNSQEGNNWFMFPSSQGSHRPGPEKTISASQNSTVLARREPSLLSQSNYPSPQLSQTHSFFSQQTSIPPGSSYQFPPSSQPQQEPAHLVGSIYDFPSSQRAAQGQNFAATHSRVELGQVYNPNSSELARSNFSSEPRSSQPTPWMPFPTQDRPAQAVSNSAVSGPASQQSRPEVSSFNWDANPAGSTQSSSFDPDGLGPQPERGSTADTQAQRHVGELEAAAGAYDHSLPPRRNLPFVRARSSLRPLRQPTYIASADPVPETEMGDVGPAPGPVTRPETPERRGSPRVQAKKRAGRTSKPGSAPKRTRTAAPAASTIPAEPPHSPVDRNLRSQASTPSTPAAPPHPAPAAAPSVVPSTRATGGGAPNDEDGPPLHSTPDECAGSRGVGEGAGADGAAFDPLTTEDQETEAEPDGAPVPAPPPVPADGPTSRPRKKPRGASGAAKRGRKAKSKSAPEPEPASAPEPALAGRVAGSADRGDTNGGTGVASSSNSAGIIDLDEEPLLEVSPHGDVRTGGSAVHGSAKRSAPPDEEVEGGGERAEVGPGWRDQDCPDAVPTFRNLVPRFLGLSPDERTEVVAEAMAGLIFQHPFLDLCREVERGWREIGVWFGGGDDDDDDNDNGDCA